MTVRADHVSGLAFIGIGALIIALSGDLSFGSLSFPGSGFLPTILASLLMILGVALMLRARESEPVSSIEWDDLRHAGPVIAICRARNGRLQAARLRDHVRGHDAGAAVAG